MRLASAALCAALLALGASATPDEVGVSTASTSRTPLPWRTLTPQEHTAFDLGHAVFNTQWVPAGQPAGRRDGLGPLFNAASCDACHNSRRRGRGPDGPGPAPSELVMQLGTRGDSGAVVRGTRRFGHILNTAAISGHVPETVVLIDYTALQRRRPDGSTLSLRVPRYTVTASDGQPLDADTLLMPRMASSTHGVGLLEHVPEDAVLALAARPGSSGHPAWVDTAHGRRLGRFGWQATEADVAGQTATAFSREMGLTSPLVARDDCGDDDRPCRDAPDGGSPEVEQALFEAVVRFQQLEAVPRTPDAARRHADATGRRLFDASGCSACHAPQLPLDDGRSIAAFTDLLLHDLGEDLADRDVAGRSVSSRWRTAPLWGLNAAFATGRPVHLLHDGRARGIDEAIAWHGGDAAAARARYEALTAAERARLVEWVSSL